MSNSNILIYQTEDGQTKIQTRLENEIEFFQISRSNINKHVLNIFPRWERIQQQVQLSILKPELGDEKNLRNTFLPKLMNREVRVEV